MELMEQGLDSMSATELIHNLEEEFNIEIGPDVLFDYPLFDQFAEEIEGRVAEQHQMEPQRSSPGKRLTNWWRSSFSS